MQFSQNNEENILQELLGNNFTGTVLDFGANSGVHLSNTRLLMEKGASGCFVEPSITAFKQLIQNYWGNGNAHLFRVAISDKCGIVNFWESNSHLNQGDVSLLSSIQHSELNRWKGTNNEFTQTSTPVWDFKTFLQHSPIKTFTVISIDIEGEDVKVLRQMDLTELKCKVLIIEWNSIEEIKRQFNLSTESSDELGTRIDDIEDAMDEYAKLEAIAFAKFAMDNTLQDMNLIDEDKWELDTKEGYTHGLITSAQLYELYIQSKK